MTPESLSGVGEPVPLPPAETKAAGRELDAEIAEKVMGWTVAHYPHGSRVVGYSPVHANYYEAVDGQNPDGVKRSSLGGDWSYWSPSRDIAAAWLVVEKMAERKPDPWMLTLTNWLYYGEGWYQAEFRSHPLGPAPVEARGESPAHAICLAALAALSSGPSVPKDE